MTKKPKKHVWSLLTCDEGSWVVDRRKMTGDLSGSTIEDQTLAKISRYDFGKRVIFKGFDTPQIDPPANRIVRENSNCISRETKHVLFVGRRNIFWFLKKKEE